MHPLFTRADKLTGEAIGAAIEVHRVLGPMQTILEQEETESTKGCGSQCGRD